MIMRLLLTAVTLVLVACKNTEESTGSYYPSSQQVFLNASVFDVHSAKYQHKQTLVVENGRFRFVGADDQAQEFVSPGAERIDLQGRYVYPGFVDSHTHPGLIAAFPIGSDSAPEEARLPVNSKEALFDYLKQYSRTYWYKPVILLGEWDVETFLPEGPTKEELDEIFPWRPVVLADNSGHSFWLNSAALWLFGIDENTPDISENISYFVKDEHGQPTGWAKEFAMLPYVGDFMLSDSATLKQGVEDYLGFLSQRGVTSIYDAGNFLWDDEIYSVVAELDREGKLPVRYEGTFHIWDPKQLNVALQEFKRLRDQYSGERLQFNTIKIHFDGVSELMTSAMLEPFGRDKNNRGGVLFDANRLSQFLIQLEAEGVHLHLHTVGDWAVREALDAVELARSHLGRPLGIEVSLAHLEVVHPDDIKRFAELDVSANFTPHWFGGDHFGEAGANNLGDDRAVNQQLANHFIAAGANVTFSSDVTTGFEAPRANPFQGMQMAMTRLDIDDAHGDVLGPISAQVSMADALRAYTANGLKQLGMESAQDLLSSGATADFYVLEQDLFSIETKDIHKTLPSLVVVGGRVEVNRVSPSR